MRHEKLKDSPLIWELDPKNNPQFPYNISSHSTTKLNWICNNGHHWFASPLNRSLGLNCPFCVKTKKPKNEIILTGDVKLSSKNNTEISLVSKDSSKTYRWECQNGHEWLNTVYNQLKDNVCTRCKYTILDAKTFVKQQYPNVLVTILPIDRDYNKGEIKPEGFVFFEDEIYHKWDIVKSILDNYEDRIKQINCRLEYQILSMDEGYNFEKENSLLSTPRYGYSLALQKEGITYQLCRYLPMKDGTIKIFGISTRNGYNVPGGHAKLLREIIKNNPNHKKLVVSFNTRYNNGEVWKTLGFKFKKATKLLTLSDGFVRMSSKSELEAPYWIQEPGMIMLEKML